MVKVKLCGLCRTEDVEAVNRIRPDFAGFVVNYPKSRRSVGGETLRRLTDMLAEGIAAVGVFADVPPEEIEALSDCLDYIQLHGRESAEYAVKLKRRTGKPIVKAFVQGEGATAEEIDAFPADYVLLDSGRGSGRTFDYSGLGALTRPYFLAGGLTVRTLPSALAMKPFAVDISSGAETDGKKDENKMRAIVSLVRGEA